MHTTIRLTAIFTLVLIMQHTSFAANFSLTDLKCEYRSNPVGIDTTEPRLSWRLESAERGAVQSAYEILVASTPEKLNEADADLWNTGRVESGQSVHVEYAGAPLTSRRECFWKVRVWDGKGNVSPWSEVASWSMGLLEPTDWVAQWIGLDSGVKPSPALPGNWIWHPGGEPASSAPVGTRYFRKVFELPKGDSIENAMCYATADNSFKLFVNGKEMGQGSDFHTAVEMNILEKLVPGTNVIAISAENAGDSANPAGVIASCTIALPGGLMTEIVTDDSWRTSESVAEGWNTVDLDDANWKAAQVLGANGIDPWGEVTLPGGYELPARMLRKEFETAPAVKRATAYVSGQGVFELYVNGDKIGDQVLAPACSEYDKRVFYMTFDVTENIQDGANAIGVMLGNGRYFSPRPGWDWARTYGYPRLLLQLEVENADGSVQRIVSDGSWKLTTDGPIRENNEFDGEVYDARMEIAGWSEAGFDDGVWQSVEPMDAPGGVMSAQMQEPIRVTETLKPKAVAQPKPGVYIYDMGQNMVGWCRLKVEGPEGTEVKL
ncbi:MAG: family 78 glycoside hydrolase catalytic domain, partial [Candidatus Hydrogenedentes bacterium]|nr:family 78 glycoside hydrolase catalytic domain [Candidatus Hydrogenedentota bacterium]